MIFEAPIHSFLQLTRCSIYKIVILAKMISIIDIIAVKFNHMNLIYVIQRLIKYFIYLILIEFSLNYVH